MTAPKLSFNTEFGRFYRHPMVSRTQSALGDLVAQGRYSPNPSITNVMKSWDEGWQADYHVRLVAAYAVEHLEALQGNLEKFGEKVVKGQLQAVPNQPHPNAAIGDEVHDAIDAFIQGREEPVFSTKTALDMYAQWLNFYITYKPKVIRTEYTVWSYKHGYAGTGDLLWEVDGKLGVIDTKTGVSVRPKVAMQCAAVAEADVILDAEGNEQPMLSISTLGVLHLRPRSAKLYEIQNREAAWQAFLACKTLFDWKRYGQNEAIGEPALRTQLPPK